MKILVIAGSTQMPIDNVRTISNIFKGRTGTAIAWHAAQYNDVTLIANKESGQMLYDWEDIHGRSIQADRFKLLEYKTFDEVKVFLKEMSEQEIEKWVDSGKAMDKAGAYGIQNEFCVFVDKIDGNYTSIVGLPTQKVYDILKNYID